MNRAIVKTGAAAITAPQPQPREVTPRPPRLVMRYPTMEESVRGFDLFFAKWSTGQAVTFDQAITEASIALAAKCEVAGQETARQKAEQQHRREIEMQEREWETGEDWHVVVEDNCPLLEGGQVALRKIMHDAAIERRLLEMEMEKEHCILLLPRVVEVAC